MRKTLPTTAYPQSSLNSSETNFGNSTKKALEREAIISEHHGFASLPTKKHPIIGWNPIVLLCVETYYCVSE